MDFVSTIKSDMRQPWGVLWFAIPLLLIVAAYALFAAMTV